MNKNRYKALEEYTQRLHHRSNAYQRREEGLKSKNLLALEMVEHALHAGVVVDYLLVDSWYAKLGFILKAKEIDIDIVARLPNNPKLWHFKGKYKSLQALYDHYHKIRHIKHGRHKKVRYRYFDVIAEHHSLGKMKLLFLHTSKELLVFISTGYFNATVS